MVFLFDRLIFYCEGFAPIIPVFTLSLKVPFPPELLNKPSKSKRNSLHGSSILSATDEDVKEKLQRWFNSALAAVRHFDLEKPELDERQATSSWKFGDYRAAIEALEYSVWDVQHTTGDTISVVLEDTNGVQRELSGRADYIISTKAAKCQGAALQHALCIIEIQSKRNELDCEYQIVTYLVLMMNIYALPKLTGLLVYKDGTCRAYRASRDAGGAIYEQNDLFRLYQISEILPTLLDF